MTSEIQIKDIDLPKEALWGARAIAQFLRVSVDSVYDLARDPACPIHKPSGRYFAMRSELMRWLRTKQVA